MAMRPFTGYDMGDYFAHWLAMGKKIPNAPKIFNVNWFRTDENGNFIWPGFGDNLRVLEWILKRCFNEVDARETEIGYLPKAEDINVAGLDMDPAALEGILTVDRDLWKAEAAGIRDFYQQFGDKLPKELAQELENLEARLNA